MTIQNRVKQEFGIPREHRLKPINGDLLEIIGGFTAAARSMTPEELAMSLVVVEGYSYGGQRTWAMTARSAHAGDEEEPIYGSVELNDDGDAPIAPDAALQATDAWIRSSQSTEFVPGPIVPLPVPPEMKNSAIAGLLLVRAVEAQ